MPELPWEQYVLHYRQLQVGRDEVLEVILLQQMKLHFEACAMSKACIRGSRGGTKDQANEMGR